MSDSNVVYRKTLAGEEIIITEAEMLQDSVRPWVLHNAAKRIEASARTNAEGEEKDAAALAVFKRMKAGEKPARGGGGLDDRTRHVRDILATWAAARTNLSYSAALAEAREDADSLTAKIAEAIVKAKGEKATQDRVKTAVQSFWQKKVEPELQKRLEAVSDTDDI